jgi:hypothetical protein
VCAWRGLDGALQQNFGQHAAPERVISDLKKLLTISDGAEATLLLG